MNSTSLLNLSFWEKVVSIFDILPKTIYFLYACLASAVDAMQSLIRKLAGLDTYFRADTGAAVTKTDPLTEFVYGILGFGENSSIYSALNTVFWSLAIFGLIVLVVTTMVAIIKSHYNEDTAQTNPWKYIYTAIKALLTFVIMPIIVIVGLQLTSFVLKTLDNITAGVGSEEEITSMYGDSTVARLRSAETADGKKTYTYYDFFGATNPSSNSTFSGMMFNACMYNANRARQSGGYDLSKMQTILGGFFGKGSEIEAISGSDAKLEYAAGQVDYAFANCLQLNSGYSYSSLTSECDGVARVWSVTDWYGASKSTVDGFSKYDVATVWVFYDLWQFNMIVGFAGVFVTFAIMISIVIGLMSRLIKGAALFLVYPSILGIAPLDDFKAFKSWGQMFMQQIMMAFGSIVGMNLLLLILPYVQQIEFFEVAIINYIVNVVMMITGLIMAKDFISIVSGFVGGADANASGGEMKGQVAGAIKSGVAAPARIVGGAARITSSAVTAPIRAGKKINNWRKARNLRNTAQREDENLRRVKRSKETEISGYDEQISSKETENARLQTLAKNMAERQAKSGAFADIAQNARDEAFAQGLRGDAVTEAGNKAFEEAKEKFAQDWLAKDGRYKQNTGDIENLKRGKSNSEAAIKEAEDRAKEAGEKASEKGFIKRTVKKKDAEGNEVTEEVWETSSQKAGRNIADGLRGLASQINKGIDGITLGKTIGDSILKTISSGAEGFGLDKTINTIKTQFGEALSFKGGPFKPKKEGDALQRQIAGEQKKQADKQTELLKEISKKLDKQNNSSGNSGGTPPASKP